MDPNRAGAVVQKTKATTNLLPLVQECATLPKHLIELVREPFKNVLADFVR